MSSTTPVETSKKHFLVLSEMAAQLEAILNRAA